MINIDIAEVIRQKQQKQPKSITIVNGKLVVIPDEDIDPSEIVPQDD